MVWVSPVAGQRTSTRCDGGGGPERRSPGAAASTEAAAAADGAVDRRACRCRVSSVDLDARARSRSRLERTPSSSSASQWLPLAGVRVERAVGRVASEGAAHLLEDVLVAVVVDVAEGDRRGPSAGGRSCPAVVTSWKRVPAVVAEHPVGHQRAEVGVAGAEVEVEPAVVVEVAEVEAHAGMTLSEAGRLVTSANVPSPLLW